jgi:hypothetical protein
MWAAADPASWRRVYVKMDRPRKPRRRTIAIQLLVSGAKGDNGAGYGAVLAFDVAGNGLGTFCDDSRVADRGRQPCLGTGNVVLKRVR